MSVAVNEYTPGTVPTITLTYPPSPYMLELVVKLTIIECCVSSPPYATCMWKGCVAQGSPAHVTGALTPSVSPDGHSGCFPR